MNTMTRVFPYQTQIHFSATAKTPATKSDFGGKLDYQVKDLASGIRQLRYLLDFELRNQKDYHLLGYIKVKNGERDGLITDEYLALWNVAQKLGDKNSVTQQERDAFNIAFFLLMNEDAHETGDTDKLVFKKTDAHGVIQIRLPEDFDENSKARRVGVILTSILCPGTFVIPDRPITLDNFDSKIPKRTQLQNLEKKANDRLAIGTARKEQQETIIQAHIDKINLENKRKQEEAIKKAEAERLKSIRLAEEFRKKSGLAAVADRYTERHTQAQTFKYPVFKHREKALKAIQGILDAGNLTHAEIQPLQKAVDKMTQIMEVPVLEYQAKDVSAAQSLLNEKISPKIKKQIENVSFGYEMDNYGEPMLNRELVDRTVALWEVVTELLTKSPKTLVEEEAIDVGLFMLNHIANYNAILNTTNRYSGKTEQEPLFRNYQNYSVDLYWRNDLVEKLFSKDPEAIEEVIAETVNLHFGYPKEEDWKKIMNNMKNAIENGADHLERQKAKLKESAYWNSPQGRQRRQEIDEQNRIQSERWRREHEAYEAAREQREWDERHKDDWK